MNPIHNENMERPLVQVPEKEVIVPAQARDTSRRQWLRYATMVAGFVATGGLAQQVLAQTSAPGTDAPASTKPPIPGVMDSTMTPPAPTASQAVPNASINPDSSNPNNPAKTIPQTAKTAAPSDVEILNFALGLEYLEADFYAGIVAAHQNRAYLPPKVLEAAQKLADDEAAHVSAILEILTTANATPVAKPQFKFPDNVYISPIAFLDLAATFEVTGVGAYLGAAPKVVSNSGLRFAASVYGVEARHVGLIRMLGGLDPSPTETEIPLTTEQVMDRVKPFIVS